MLRRFLLFLIPVMAACGGTLDEGLGKESPAVGTPAPRHDLTDYTSPYGAEQPNASAADDADVAAMGGMQTASVRYCSSTYNCRPQCVCSSGTCVPDGFGPPPEGDYCSQPPVRSCSSSSNCRSGCTCSSGTCRSTGSATDCHLPLVDAYEADNTYSQAKAYTGTPQYAHNFHRNGDEDWVLVYMGTAGTVVFETFDVVELTADTHLRVYQYQNGMPGTLVGSNDDICGYYWLASCQASRVVLNVAANTAYYVRITNAATVDYREYDASYPSYSLRIAYQ